MSAFDPVDDEDLTRFRAWLVGRGYSEGTARLWSKRVKSAHARGISEPEEVNSAYRNHQQLTRAGMREALQRFAEFREAGR